MASIIKLGFCPGVAEKFLDTATKANVPQMMEIGCRILLARNVFYIASAITAIAAIGAIYATAPFVTAISLACLAVNGVIMITTAYTLCATITKMKEEFLNQF